MAVTSHSPQLEQLGSIRPSLLRSAGIGGLLGGLVLFVIMAGYNAANAMGFWAILNSCFAAFVFGSAQITSMGEPAMPGHAMSMGMGNEPVVTSHIVVGGLLHLAVSVGAGVGFAIALALLIRAGFRALANPLLYVLGGAVGGALLYLIMMEAVAPSLNRTIIEFTPRMPFFLAHLAFGATVAAWTYWRATASQKQVLARPDNGYAPA